MDYAHDMILQCPECQARFAVPDRLIPPEGRTVKCGRCAHQWHADAIEGAQAPSFAELAAAAAGEGNDAAPVIARQLPVVTREPIGTMPFIAAALAMLILWPALQFTAHYRSWIDAPVARSIYGIFGIHTTEGLAFDSVTMQKGETPNGQTKYLITGSISNHAEVVRLVPTVRVELKNKGGKALWTHEYEVGELLDPGAAYPFRIDNVSTSFADSVTSIVLDLGHGLQLTMR